MLWRPSFSTELPCFQRSANAAALLRMSVMASMAENTLSAIRWFLHMDGLLVRRLDVHGHFEVSNVQK